MRIAHLSDFHARRHVYGHPSIIGRRSRKMPDLLEKAIDAISKQWPDVLAVTGDLVDTPFYGMDDPACLARTRQDLQLIREVIDPIGCPVLYLFGNHDHPSTFHDVFSDQNPDRTIGGYRFVSFHDEEVTDHFAERLGPQRERFKQALEDKDPTPQIHLQHYMIWPENNQGYPHSYREASELRDRIVFSGKVRLSLSGHYHKGINAFDEAGTWFSTSRAFCEAPHPFRIYDIEDKVVIQTEHTLGAETVGHVVFIEGVQLLELAKSDSSFRSALAAAQSDGWSLIGIVDDRDLTGDASETACDALLGELSESGLELETLVRHPEPDEISSTYKKVGDALGCDLAESQALVFDRRAVSENRLGTRTYAASLDTALCVLKKATTQ